MTAVSQEAKSQKTPLTTKHPNLKLLQPLGCVRTLFAFEIHPVARNWSASIKRRSPLNLQAAFPHLSGFHCQRTGPRWEETSEDQYANHANLVLHPSANINWLETTSPGPSTNDGAASQTSRETAFLTCNHTQSNLVFVVIEPAWNFHAASIHPRVFLLHLPDGQRHVALLEAARQQVPLRQPAAHGCPVWLDHLISAASAGDGPPAPAHREPPVVLDVIFACQSHVCPHCGDDVVRGHTTWNRKAKKKWVRSSEHSASASCKDLLRKARVRMHSRVGSLPQTIIFFSFLPDGMVSVHLLSDTEPNRSVAPALTWVQITWRRPWYARTNNFCWQKRNAEKSCFPLCAFGSLIWERCSVAFWWVDRQNQGYLKAPSGTFSLCSENSQKDPCFSKESFISSISLTSC